MSHEHVYKFSSRYLQKWLKYNIKYVKNRHFSRHFATLPWFSEFCFLTDFDASKNVLGSFFAFFVKIWPKNMYRSSKPRNFLVWLFAPGDLRWPWPVLWSQSTGNDTYRCQWYYPCRLISGSNFSPCTGSSRTGLSNGVLNLEIGPVVWDISGGALWPPPPPAGRVTNQTPAGRGLTAK